jgi:uncharacterized protein YkwD
MRFGAISAAALLSACAGVGGAQAAATGSTAGARSALPVCRAANVAPNGSNPAIVDAATLCLMNQVRAAHGLRLLHANPVLAVIATGQAADMVRGDYFGDQSISGRSAFARIMSSSYPARRSTVNVLTAQNIGWGTGPNATPQGIVRAWMESPQHRRIILTGAYRDAGVGVAPAVPSILGAGWLGGTYAVEFGARRPQI